MFAEIKDWIFSTLSYTVNIFVWDLNDHKEQEGLLQQAKPVSVLI